MLTLIHISKGAFCFFVDRQQNRWCKVSPPLMVKLSGRVKAAPGNIFDWAVVDIWRYSYSHPTNNTFLSFSVAPPVNILIGQPMLASTSSRQSDHPGGLLRTKVTAALRRKKAMTRQRRPRRGRARRGRRGRSQRRPNRWANMTCSSCTHSENMSLCSAAL